ncbi:MAG: hypothetical protein R3F59_21405 [Myxococcota bacterium]
MQLLLPGIFYALQLAFTDMIAVLDPERAALSRSGGLTAGMRGRLFRMMAGWWILGMVLTLGADFVYDAAVPPPEFAALDTNQDNFVDHTEAHANETVRRAFAAIDADRSDRITPAELEAWANDPSNDVFSVEGAGRRITEMLFDPTSTPLVPYLVSEVLWGLLTWWLTLALLVLYEEREGQVRAKAALRKLEREGAAAEAQG